MKKHFLKQAWAVALVLLCMASKAQQHNTKYNVRIYLTAYKHFYDCGTDNGSGNPDPRYKFSFQSLGDATQDGAFIFKQNDQPCGGYVLNPGTLMYNKIVCSSDSRLRIFYTSWEEDNGSDDDYGLGDDNFGANNVTYTLFNEPRSKTIQLDHIGNYNVDLRIEWTPVYDQAVQLTATADSICKQSPLTISVAASSPPIFLGYNWYYSLLPNGLPDVATFFHSSNSLTLPAGALDNGNHDFYVTGVLDVNGNGSCESGPTKKTIHVRNDASTLTPIYTTDSVCAGNITYLTVSGATNTETIRAYFDADCTIPASDVVNAYAGNVGVQTYPILPDNTSPTPNVRTIYIRATSAFGCVGATTSVQVFLVFAPPPPTISNITVCANQPIRLIATSTVTNSFFGWVNPNNVVLATHFSSTNYDTLILSGIATPGNYTYKVSNGIGYTTRNGFPLYCYSDYRFFTITVIAPPILVATTIGDTTCPGGTAFLQASGNSGTYLWYKNAVGGAVLGSGAAFTTPALMTTDSFFVAVSNGVCEGPRKKVIAVVQPLQPLTGNGYSTCPGDNGTLQINPVFGATQYNWYNAATGGTLVHQGVTFITPPLFSTTTYYVSYVKRGCESNRIALTVTIIPLPLLTANNITICANNTALPSVAGVNNITQYLWYNAATGGNLIHAGVAYTTPILTTTTTYYVSYKNGNCESGRTPVTVTVNTLPVANAVTSNSPLCEHQTLQLNVNTVGGVSYLWNGPNGFASSLPNPTIIDIVEANHQGFYTVQLTNTATGCKSLPVSVLVDIHHFPDNIIAINNSPKCEGSIINLDATSLYNSSYSWSGPNGFTASIKTPILSNVKMINAGQYKVVLQQDGCISDTAKTTVVIWPLPISNAGNDTTIIQGSSFQLHGSGGITFGWNNSPYLSTLNISNPVVNNLPIGVHKFVLNVWSDKGCSSADTVQVTVLPNLSLDIPNLITPNGDGYNDKWKVKYLENINNFTVEIYTRGGAKIFETKTVTQYWDGTYNGTKLPDGAYWYRIATPQKLYTGAVTIKR